MLACHVFWMPKAGNTLAEYEDAFWPREDRCDASAPLRLAVADGATETSFSGLWARLLVGSYGRGRLTAEASEEELRRIRRVWRRAVGHKPLPWYAEEKLRSGAFSSLLGVTLQPPESAAATLGDWHAMAIGDSCLVQARRSDVVRSFPFSRSDEFNSRPRLISSLDDDGADDFPFNAISGSWQAGDTFYLMTDALACCALRGLESNEPVFARLDALHSQAEFETLVSNLRSTTGSDGAPLLKNDDVTLVRYSIASHSQK
ncbi:MAG: protein phosphatase 2C domain-containing protein [Deltaproteobacteria bacterium]